MRWFRYVLATGLSLGALAGCDASRPGQPPRVRYGREACAACRMIISEETTAAALRTQTGDVLHFDDIGCLVRALQQTQAPATEVWVHDAASGSWIDGRRAFYVESHETSTPMGSGLLAFATREAAEAAARDHAGRWLTFAELGRVVEDTARRPDK